MANREWGRWGLKLPAFPVCFGLPGVLIMVCVAIYAVLDPANPFFRRHPRRDLWGTAGYTVLLPLPCLRQARYPKVFLTRISV